MSPIELQAALAGVQTIGRDVLVLECVDSTNEFLFRLTTPATPEGLVVLAETQTAGRGQHGRRWESAASKGLWLSILLRPKLAPNESPRLTRWAAQTVAETIRAQFSLGATVKPPNDIYIDKRKVAGVLLEMRVAADGTHIGILGIGINVNHAREDFPVELRDTASSIAMALGREVDRQNFAVALLRELDRTYRETAAS
ncbi:MAG TPA: biotin--[acetyl-CoA-carboxylase] ligase [Chthoniobacterales bacterium]|jgi:BirA family biotin operon repressor/biotin-[acetyl-CoA-carboxylase] ligase